MALYLGRDKVNINLDGAVWHLNILSPTPIAGYSGMLSYDHYTLTDCNGIILLPSDYIAPITTDVILSSDNYILTDSKGIYLTIKESE